MKVMLPAIFAFVLAVASNAAELTVQPIVVTADDGTGTAAARLDPERVGQVYAAAGIRVRFLEEKTMADTEVRDGRVNLDTATVRARKAGLFIDTDPVVHLFFVNAVDGRKGPLGRARQRGNITYIAQRPTATNTAQDAFAVAHELGHNLGLIHAADDPAVPDHVPNLMGDGPYAERIGPGGLHPSQVKTILASPLVQKSKRTLPAASWNHLPRWRGFNLLEKFNVGRNEPFREDDFRMIAELGFNFVRLPMDYRCWIVGGDWRRLREDTLREIDQAVEYGKRYGIHVMINFHRAPGYTVAKPPEKKSLWTDPEAQAVCAMHWAAFAARYKGIPNRNLSFNLLNEPADVEAAAHAAAISIIVTTIRAKDPDRLIVCDARQWGGTPSEELIPLRVAQATRGYQPMEITHYKASWAHMEDSGLPSWPMLDASGWLAGPGKKELGAPLRIEGSLDGVSGIRVRVHRVSGRSRLVVRADGRTVFDHVYQCGAGTGEWKTVVFQPQWNIYQNVYDRDYETTLPAGVRSLVLDNKEGDWMTLSELALRRADGTEDVLALRPLYGRKPVVVQYRPGQAQPFFVPGLSGREWLKAKCVAPFRGLQDKGVGVMVGEFGAYRHTPHPVVLRWMQDCLTNWKEAEWGWALWNFRGSFGILDSDRDDVAYEDFHGHKLDREMLELLQAY